MLVIQLYLLPPLVGYPTTTRAKASIPGFAGKSQMARENNGTAIHAAYS